MLSATIADNNASIPAKKAIVKAEGNNNLILLIENIGSWGKGIPEEILGNLDPMVSTGIPKRATTKEKTAITIKYRGHLGTNFLRRIIDNNAEKPTEKVTKLMVLKTVK